MSKTVHVIHNDEGWTVMREGRKTNGVYDTKREAVASARDIARNASGQLVIRGVDGRIQQHDTYGIPRIQDPPGKRSAKIERAVDKVTRDRLGCDPLPSRG